MGKRGHSQSSKGSRDQTKSDEESLETVRLHLQDYTQRQVATIQGCSVSTVNKRINRFRDEVRAEGRLLTENAMVDEAAGLARGINDLERLQERTREYRCRACDEPVVCECGAAAEVAVLKPPDVIRGRGEIRAHRESRRKLLGVDAAQHLIVTQELTDKLKGFLSVHAEHHPESLGDVLDTLRIIGHLDELDQPPEGEDE